MSKAELRRLAPHNNCPSACKKCDACDLRTMQAHRALEVQLRSCYAKSLQDNIDLDDLLRIEERANIRLRQEMEQALKANHELRTVILDQEALMSGIRAEGRKRELSLINQDIFTAKRKRFELESAVERLQEEIKRLEQNKESATYLRKQEQQGEKLEWKGDYEELHAFASEIKDEAELFKTPPKKPRKIRPTTLRVPVTRNPNFTPITPEEIETALERSHPSAPIVHLHFEPEYEQFQ